MEDLPRTNEDDLGPRILDKDGRVECLSKA